jgi:carbamoyltransferase
MYQDHGEWMSPWDPLFLSSIVNAPRQLVDGPPLHLQRRFRSGTAASPYAWHFVDHHLAHAASAFLASPFDDAAVIALDGRGELATTTYWRGHGTCLDLVGRVDLPHSLGLLYEEVTAYLGFLRSSDEYKVMALASYGTPRYVAAFRDMVHVGDNGAYLVSNPCLEERFGPPRDRGGPLEQRHFDIARSLQLVLEESVIALARWVRLETHSPRLCLAGGVALNCVMNARLRDAGIFDDVWVQPAAGDAGTALGAALWVDARQRPSARRYRMEHAFLGPSFSDEEIEAFLRWSKLPYRRLDDIAGETAALLARDQVIGWFQGRMEFGPRALGGRSILASPIRVEMQARLNDIKDREDFRPVAPVVLEKDAGEWFTGASVAPFMLFVFDVAADKVDRIPAVRHVDGTARVQTIRRDQQPLYYDLLCAFKERTGVPVLINTSFNTRGEPIVCTPRDAIESFWTSPLDALVIGSFLLQKPTPTQGASSA